MALSLGPPFILNLFYIFKCWLYTKEHQLRLKKNNFLKKEDEKKLLHNIHNNDNKNKSKIKTQDETC